MINDWIKYNEKDAVLDAYFRLLLENKDEIALQSEIDSVKECLEEKEKTAGKVPSLDSKFPQYIVIGTMRYPEEVFRNANGYREMKKAFSDDENKMQIPVILDMQKSVNLFIEYNEQRMEACREFTHNVMWSFLSGIPVSKLNISVFDCERRGGSITPFLDFKKKVPHLFDQEIHTDAEDIYNRLKIFNNDIDERIQSKLGSKYKSIIEYNRSNPARAQLLHLLIVNDFPSGFDKESVDLLMNILKNGSRCGIYTVINYNSDIRIEGDEKTEDYIEQIKRLSSVLEVKNNRCYHVISRMPLEGYVQMADSAVNRFVEEYIEREDELKSQDLDFRNIMDSAMFNGNAGNSLDILVGVSKNGENMRIILGKESACHVLLAGAAGSGKSTLLQTLILSAMLRYSPDELNLYLLDFKGGSEFKVYENYRLPHIKLLALDAKQEFGEGILEGLVHEMDRRSVKFKEAGVTKLGEYVNKTGTSMPRILVVMDEFPILFSIVSNGKVAKNCAEQIQKIVTEGNAYGMHFIMATQSVNGISELSLSADTMEQMKVRIGLKCKEEDAEFLYGNNAAKALEMLKGPVGTAVINPDASGNEIQGFRVARCDSNIQNEMLQMIENEFRSSEYTMQIFDGSRLIHLLDHYAQSDAKIDDLAKIGVEFGELVKTASPLEIFFDKKKQHNVIICGANEKMADNLFHLFTLSVLKNKNSRVYCVDGDILVEENKSMPYYGQYERFEEQFKLAYTRGDIIRFVYELYDLYKQKKKVNDESIIFLAIKNLQFLDLIKQMLNGKYIDESEFLQENERSSDMIASDISGGVDSNTEVGMSDSQGVSELFNRLLEEGYSYGIHFILTCTDFRTIKDCENLVSDFPERFVFSLSDQDMHCLAEGVSATSLGENTVYYSDSVNGSYQLKPYLFPDINGLEKYVNDFLGDENAAKWYRKAALSNATGDAGSASAMYHLGLMYESGQGAEQDYAEAANWYEKAANAGNATAMYQLGVLYETGQGVEQNFVEAAKWYEKAANASIPDAMSHLGMLYANALGVEQSYVEAAKWYEKAATQGNTTAMYHLGLLYENGCGVEKNYAEAAKWYEKTAIQGNTTAMYHLGLLYETGQGVEQNFADAIEWYKKAADEGNTAAMNHLGLLYADGRGVEPNYAEAMKWYEKAADAGDATAMNHLGLLYENGQGVEPNYAEAMKWYEKAASVETEGAAENETNNGNADAMYHLGMLHENGRGVDQNYAEAAKWHEKAANAGNTDAMNRLGLLYEQGRGVVQSYAEAVKWYEKAVNADNADAMYNLGWLYEQGQGVEQNYAEAVKWYEKAANAGNATAMNNLGVFYNIGQGVEQSFAEAAKWYEKAANAGNPIAMKNLGVLYKQGQGVSQNYGEAAKWYEKAANAGIATAMNNLGVLYDKGQGVRKDYDEAVKWYEKAANAGVPDAMNNLGMLYENGQGVEQNFSEAAKWYEKAVNAGIPDAMKNLGALYENGRGVEQNYAEAAKLYEKAANAGIQNAMINLAELYKKGWGVEQNNEEATRWYEKAANEGNAFAVKRLSELQTKEAEKKRSSKLIIGITIVIVIVILVAIGRFIL